MFTRHEKPSSKVPMYHQTNSYSTYNACSFLQPQMNYTHCVQLECSDVVCVSAHACVRECMRACVQYMYLSVYAHACLCIILLCMYCLHVVSIKQGILPLTAQLSTSPPSLPSIPQPSASCLPRLGSRHQASRRPGNST